MDRRQFTATLWAAAALGISPEAWAQLSQADAAAASGWCWSAGR